MQHLVGIQSACCADPIYGNVIPFYLFKLFSSTAKQKGYSHENFLLQLDKDKDMQVV